MIIICKRISAIVSRYNAPAGAEDDSRASVRKSLYNGEGGCTHIYFWFVRVRLLHTDKLSRNAIFLTFVLSNKPGGSVF